MIKHRIMVVDDSPIVRKIVGHIISKESDMEVVGYANNGREALSKLDALKPDLVTLDLEMPVMGGLDFLTAVRKTKHRFPVIVLSALSQRGAVSTLEALSRGASDYMPKPSAEGGLEASQNRVKAELLPKIRALCGRKSANQKRVITPRTRIGRRPRTSASAAKTKSSSARQAPATRVPMSPSKGSVPHKPMVAAPSGGRGGPVDILCIGLSTGGPNALAEVLPKLPARFPVPIVIVQHMPPTFTRLLAERLNGKCALTVKEGEHGSVIKAGEIWIAPGGKHMCVERQRNQLVVTLNEEPPECFCRPAVDVLFRSVAKVFGNRTLACVLTGMGQDGMRGSEIIKQAGGQVVIQDEASSVVWGMPGSVYRAGCADSVHPLKEIHTELIKRVASGALSSRQNSIKDKNSLKRRVAS